MTDQEQQALFQKFLAEQAAKAAGPATAPPASGWGAAAPAPASPAAGGWGAPAAPTGVPPCLGVLVPVELRGGDGGRVEVYLQFGPEHAAPAALTGLCSALAMSGVPLKVWKPKLNGFGGGGGYGGGRGF